MPSARMSCSRISRSTQCFDVRRPAFAASPRPRCIPYRERAAGQNRADRVQQFRIRHQPDQTWTPGRLCPGWGEMAVESGVRGSPDPAYVGQTVKPGCSSDELVGQGRVVGPREGRCADRVQNLRPTDSRDKKDPSRTSNPLFAGRGQQAGSAVQHHKGPDLWLRSPSEPLQTARDRRRTTPDEAGTPELGAQLRAIWSVCGDSGACLRNVRLPRARIVVPSPLVAHATSRLRAP
jgi:hypothetical protein